MKSKWSVNLFLGFTKLTGFIPAWLFMKPKIYRQDGAPCRLPRPAILVSNHKSLLDFVLYLVVFPLRTVRFLMAEVLYNKGPFLATLLGLWGGIRVDRDGRDFSFISDALAALDDGGIVGVFPEARLPINGKPWPFTTSTAFIATHTDAPLVPVYTDGGYGLFRRARVAIGRPMTAEEWRLDGATETEQIEHLTRLLEERVYALGEEMKRAERGHRLFGFEHLPMDLARVVCAVLPPIFRIKRMTPDGKPYKRRLRGGAIVAANHTSFADPFVVGVTFWYRRLYFLVAEIVMQGRLRSALLRGVGAIKIDRNAADIEAVNRAVDRLKQGYLLSVFPQGGINRADDIDTVKSGAVLMALRADVPIIPMHILPRAKWYARRTVIIGDPIHPRNYCERRMPTTADIRRATDALAEALRRCQSANTQSTEETYEHV